MLPTAAPSFTSLSDLPSDLPKRATLSSTAADPWINEQDGLVHGIGDRHHAFASPATGGQNRSPSANGSRFRQHRTQVDAYERRQIRLVNDQQIAAQDARPALARNIVAAGNVDQKIHQSTRSSEKVDTRWSPRIGK